MPKAATETFQKIKFTLAYREGERCSAKAKPVEEFTFCEGTVKLSATSTEGRTLILKIAQPGEELGLNTTVPGLPHEMTAETGEPCQLNFVKREDFLKFLKEHNEANMQAAIQLSHDCQQACLW